MSRCSKLAASTSSQAPPNEIMSTKEKRGCMFKCQVVVKRPICTMEFCDFYFEGCTIHQIFFHHSRELMLSWTSLPYILLVQEFYAALTEINIDADEWEVVIRGVRIRISTNILTYYVGIQRRLGPYPVVKPTVVLPNEEVFQLMMGEYHYLIKSSVPQKSLPVFWRMFHLIFCHNIYPLQHHTECTSPQAQLIMIVVRLEPIDLPLFMFQTIRAEVQSLTRKGLPYSVMLTRFMLDYGIGLGIMSQLLPSSALSAVSQLDVACHMDKRQSLELQQLLHRNPRREVRLLRSWLGLPLEHPVISRCRQVLCGTLSTILKAQSRLSLLPS